MTTTPLTPLSCYILTHNSERRLAQVLASIQQIADEILIVDSGSTDQTLTIAHHFGATILTRSFDNFRDQRIFASIEQMGGKLIRTIGQACANFTMTMMAASYNLKQLAYFKQTELRPSDPQSRLNCSFIEQPRNKQHEVAQKISRFQEPQSEIFVPAGFLIQGLLKTGGISRCH